MFCQVFTLFTTGALTWHRFLCHDQQCKFVHLRLHMSKTELPTFLRNLLILKPSPSQLMACLSSLLLSLETIIPLFVSHSISNSSANSVGVLPLNYIQNLTTSHHAFCCLTDPSHLQLLDYYSSLLNKVHCPYVVYSQHRHQSNFFKIQVRSCSFSAQNLALIIHFI